MERELGCPVKTKLFDTGLAKAPLCTLRSTMLIHGGRLLHSFNRLGQLEQEETGSQIRRPVGGACCAADACSVVLRGVWRSALESVAPRSIVGSRDSLSMLGMRQPGGSPL